MWGNNQMFGMGGFDPSMLQRLGQGGFGGAAPPQGLGMVQNAAQMRPGGYAGAPNMIGGVTSPWGNIQNAAQALGNPGALGMMADKLKQAGLTRGGGTLGTDVGKANPGGFGQFANPAAMQDPRNRRARGPMTY